MTAESTDSAFAWASQFLANALAALNVGGVGSRLHPTSFISFFVVGIGIYLWRRRHGEKVGTSVFSFLFPKSVYLSGSSGVDLKIYIASSLIVLDRVGIRILSTAAIASFVSSGILSLTGQAAAETPLSGWSWAACLFCVALAYDFGGYWLHRISHENQALWPFHKVHHSAEGLTPLTVFRIHPMYPFFGSFFIPLCVGPVVGVIHAAFGQQDLMAITAVHTAYMIFNLTGSNLRHSHLWLSYGPHLSKILVSPAMHQIHHSLHPDHWNKNYAEIFALWDWLFGTVYIPEHREELVFGVETDEAGNVVQPHPTLRAALVEPYLESIEALKASFGRKLGVAPGGPSADAE